MGWIFLFQNNTTTAICFKNRHEGGVICYIRNNISHNATSIPQVTFNYLYTSMILKKAFWYHQSQYILWIWKVHAREFIYKQSTLRFYYRSFIFCNVCQWYGKWSSNRLAYLCWQFQCHISLPRSLRNWNSVKSGLLQIYATGLLITS